MTSAFSVILHELAPIEGTRLLDIGCGDGGLCKRLAEAGAIPTGIDPSETAIASAAARHPGLSFSVGKGQSLPFDDGQFDHAVFLNSLHHVEPEDMETAIIEAMRVRARKGRVIVVEPTANGSFFEAFKLIEDETEVRERAQRAIASVVENGRAVLAGEHIIDRVEDFKDAEAFFQRVSGQDEDRKSAIHRHREELEFLFLKHSTPSANGARSLTQPLTIHVLEKPPVGATR